MNKRTLAHLERLWIAEVNGKSTQLHPKTADKLAAAGLVHIVKHEHRDRLGVFSWTTHELTHAGRYAYCATCSDAR